MPLYFLLGTLTENGQRMLLHNPDLVIEAIRECDCEGAKILGQYAVLGKYDYVMIAEANNNEAAARLALEIGVKAGLHTETLPAMAIGIMVEGQPDDREARVEAAENPTPSEEWRLPRGSP